MHRISQSRHVFVQPEVQLAGSLIRRALQPRRGITAQTPLDGELPCTLAQVDEAVEAELAATLEDVLARRVPLLLRARDQGLGAAAVVARHMGQRLGWTEAAVAAQVQQYQRTVAASRAFRD